MTQTENNLLPTLKFYADFPEDWDRFDDKVRKDISGFLKHLQSDPFDPRITEMSEKNGGYYATRIGPVVVYWKLARREDSIESGNDRAHAHASVRFLRQGVIYDRIT